jgi:hypothetical protein
LCIILASDVGNRSRISQTGKAEIEKGLLKSKEEINE